METSKETGKYLKISNKNYQVYKKGDKLRVTEVTYTKLPVCVLIAF